MPESPQDENGPAGSGQAARADEDEWVYRDPSIDMPVISGDPAPATSGWTREDLSPIYRSLNRPWSPITDAHAAAGGVPMPPPANGNYGSDESENGLPEDDDFPDPLQDRDFLEFVLFQRACADRRAASGMPAVPCTRHEPCADCCKHEGAYFPRTLWQFISDAALEHHFGNYLQLRATLPPWQPTRPSNLQAPQLIVGSAPQSQSHADDSEAGIAGAASGQVVFGPEVPLEFNDSLEHV